MDALDTDSRFPETLRPIAPTRRGPIMVVVYLSPVAPGNPEGRDSDSSSVMGGLDGAAISRHWSMSANPEART